MKEKLCNKQEDHFSKFYLMSHVYIIVKSLVSGSILVIFQQVSFPVIASMPQPKIENKFKIDIVLNLLRNCNSFKDL